MNKRIAVLVNQRQEEAIRMSIGLTLADDTVDIFLIDKKLNRNKKNLQNIDTGKEIGIHVYSNCEEDTDIQRLSTESITSKLLEYDHILPY